MNSFLNANLEAKLEGTINLPTQTNVMTYRISDKYISVVLATLHYSYKSAYYLAPGFLATLHSSDKSSNKSSLQLNSPTSQCRGRAR
jgi:hypothetical protein